VKSNNVKMVFTREKIFHRASFVASLPAGNSNDYYSAPSFATFLIKHKGLCKDESHNQ